jgi:hypothetical protein
VIFNNVNSCVLALCTEFKIIKDFTDDDIQVLKQLRTEAENFQQELNEEVLITLNKNFEDIINKYI